MSVVAQKAGLVLVHLERALKRRCPAAIHEGGWVTFKIGKHELRMRASELELAALEDVLGAIVQQYEYIRHFPGPGGFTGVA